MDNKSEEELSSAKEVDRVENENVADEAPGAAADGADAAVVTPGPAIPVLESELLRFIGGLWLHVNWCECCNLFVVM